MKSMFALCAVLAAMLASAGPARPLSGVESQKKTKAEQEADLKAQKAKEAEENDLVAKVRDAVKNEQWEKAAFLYKRLIQMEPAVWIYQVKLGDTQNKLGQYDDALHTYEAALKLAWEQLKTITPDPYPPGTKTYIGGMLTDEGNIYLKQKKNDLAVAAYMKAAEIAPLPADAYFNLCATQYNMGMNEGALPACEKAIAADPRRADAYFIKGSVLIAESKKDSTGKMVPPPGAVDALKKYLELAPSGPHATDVKAMLDFVGVKQ